MQLYFKCLKAYAYSKLVNYYRALNALVRIKELKSMHLSTVNKASTHIQRQKKLLKLSSEEGKFNHWQTQITERRKGKVTYNYSEYFIKGNANCLLWSFIRV